MKSFMCCPETIYCIAHYVTANYNYTLVDNLIFDWYDKSKPFLERVVSVYWKLLELNEKALDITITQGVKDIYEKELIHPHYKMRGLSLYVMFDCYLTQTYSDELYNNPLYRLVEEAKSDYGSEILTDLMDIMDVDKSQWWK